MKIKKNKALSMFDVGIFNDLAFLLIIFFITLATYGFGHGFIFRFKKDNSSAKVTPIKARIISEDCLIYHDSRHTTLEFLEAIGEHSEQSVILFDVDGGVRYGQLIQIIDACRGRGFCNYSFEESRESS